MPRHAEPDDEPAYEEIGGGLIEDAPSQASAGGSRSGGATGVEMSDGDWEPWADGAAPVRRARLHSVVAVLSAAGRECWAAIRSVRFWLGVAAGLLAPAAVAVGLASFAMANQWFEYGGAWIGGVVIGASFVPLSAAVLGTIWGFGRPRTEGAAGAGARVAASGAKGLVFAVVAGMMILLAGAPAEASDIGGPPAQGTAGLAGAAVVVIFVEALLFGALGAGARLLFRRALPGALLAGVLVAVLGVVNVVVTVLLLPSTFVPERVSVPVNVSRDASGRLVSYECVGDPVRLELVLHSERVLWISAGNPAVIYGTVASGLVPESNDIAWLLPELQRGFEGPAREVACINGVASDEIQPAPPLWLVGLAGQAAIAAVLLVPGRRLAVRRLARATDGS